jgi:hypothetical protein
VEALPGVEAVTFTSFQPLTNSRPERRFSILDGAEDAASYCVVATNFFSVYRVRLLQGRTFDRFDRAGSPAVAIVGEFNDERVVGRVWPAAENHVVVLELTY